MIKFERFSFSEEPQFKTKERLSDLRTETKKEKYDESFFKEKVIGYYFSKYPSETGNEFYEKLFKTVSFKDIGFSNDVLSLIVSVNPIKKDYSYYGFGGIGLFVLEMTSRLVHENLLGRISNLKDEMQKFIDLLLNQIVVQGTSQFSNVRAKEGRASETFTYITFESLKRFIESLSSVYKAILTTLLKSGLASFIEVKTGKYMLVSTESLIANENIPSLNINTWEAYVKWFKVWINSSSNNSIVLKILKNIKIELENFIQENDLQNKSHKEIMNYVYLFLQNTTNKILYNKIKADDSPALYKAFNQFLKLNYFQNGKIKFFIEALLSNAENSSTPLEELANLFSNDLKLVLDEESFELQEISCMFTEDIKAINLVKFVTDLFVKLTSKESYQNFNGALTLEALAEIGKRNESVQEGIYSKVYQNILDGLVQISISDIKERGVIFYYSDFEQFYGQLPHNFLGIEDDAATIQKRKYLLSVCLEKEEGPALDFSFDPFTVLDTITCYPETSIRKEKSRPTVETNVVPYNFNSIIHLLTSGELSSQCKVNSENYFYLSEIVYSVIKEVYKDTANSISEIIFDTNKDRTELAYKLLVERGVFEKAFNGAFYFYLSELDSIVKSLYGAGDSGGAYYLLFLSWFMSAFGVNKESIKLKMEKDLSVEILKFKREYGYAGYWGWRKNPKDEHNTDEKGNPLHWTGKGFAVLENEILEKLSYWTYSYPYVKDRQANLPNIVKEREFFVLTKRIKSISENIPFEFIKAITVKRGFYNLLENADAFKKLMFSRIYLETIDTGNFEAAYSLNRIDPPSDSSNARNVAFKSLERAQIWDDFYSSSKTLIPPLYKYGVLKLSSKIGDNDSVISKTIRKFLDNFIDMMQQRYLDSDTNEVKQEFLDVTLPLIQAISFNGIYLKEEGLKLGLKYEDITLADVENEIIAKLSEEVYIDKISKITFKEERSSIPKPTLDVKESKPKPSPKKKTRDVGPSFYSQFGIDEEEEITDL